MGRERFPKQSLGALYGRIKQVCPLGAKSTRDARAYFTPFSRAF